jgi:hypothetical protein
VGLGCCGEAVETGEALAVVGDCRAAGDVIGQTRRAGRSSKRQDQDRARYGGGNTHELSLNTLFLVVG